MLKLSTLALMAIAQPSWNDDYAKATDQAIAQKKDLVVYFRAEGELDDALNQADVKKMLDKFVCLKVPVDYQVDGKKLLDYDALEDMAGSPGLAVISYHDKKP